MKQKKLIHLGRASMPYVFILPTVLLMAIILFFPVLRVFGYSFMDYNSSYGKAPDFIMFQNYIQIFTNDPVFYKVLLNSLKWVFAQVSLQLLIGGVLALLLNQKFFGRNLFRVASFIPWAVSGVLTAIIWSLVFNEHFGVLNDLLMRLGLIQEKIAWTANMNTVFGSVATAEVWRGIPFFAISILAALQSVPVELYESAKIDGASAFELFSHITFPHIKDTVLLTTLLRAVWEFNNVDVIFNLTGGGPANKTTTLSMYITNQAIKTGNYGYGSALASISFLILTVFAVIYLNAGKFAKNNDE